MIARVRLLLPSYVGMQLTNYQAVTITGKAEVPWSTVTVFPPIRVKREVPNEYEKQQAKFDDIWQGWSPLEPKDALTDHTVGGERHWWANCLILDVKAEGFPTDEARYDVVRLAAEITNDLLTQLRWRANQPYIKPIPIDSTTAGPRLRTEFLVEYFKDDGTPLTKEEGYPRWGAVTFKAQTGAVTPDTWMLAWNDLADGVEVPLWEELLLDVAASDLHTRNVVTAFSALEVFIRRHLDLAAAASGADSVFWTWLMNRNNDYDRQPAVAELFDAILHFVDGRSLKVDAPDLWASFQELKRTRNQLVHDGHAPGLTPNKVTELIQKTRAIVDWVQQKPAPEVEPFKLQLVIDETPDEAHSKLPQGPVE